MDKHSVNWSGPWVALVTPFDAQGQIDGAAYRRNVDIVIEGGCTGVVANGCTGEFWAQSFDERVQVLKIAVEAARGRATVVGGTGAITTEEAIELTRAAKNVGCDGAMILPTYFVKPPVEDVIVHYETISDAVDFPIMLYNIPSAASVALTPELVDRLADLKNVVAIKESSRDFVNFYRTLEKAGDRIHVFIGPGGFFGAAAQTVGAAGFVEGIPNYWTGITEVWHAAARGDMVTALARQRKALAVRELIEANGRNIYTGGKAAMNALGLPGGYPRRPLRAYGEPHLTQLREGFAKLGIHGAMAKAAE
jgi:dihydrodipicolinate synthase/N-acetylneuraminate lyase